MSVNNVDKLAKIAGGKVKKVKKVDSRELLKPIRQTKVEEKENESLGERFNSLITAGLDKTMGEPMKTEKKAARLDSAEGSQGEKEISSVDDLTSALEDLEESFRGVSDSDYVPDEYKEVFPPSVNLEKMEVPEVDEEKIRGEVELAEKLKTEAAKKEKEKQTEKEIENLYAFIESAKENSSSANEKINEIFDSYRLSSENDSLKRGLARSSVAVLALDKIEKSRAEELSNAAKELSLDITNAEKEIAGLQSALGEALGELDLELSVNINNELSKKIEALEKKRAEAIEFNNNIEKIKAEFDLKRADKADEWMELEDAIKERYEGAASRDKEQKMFEAAMAYFGALDRKTALTELIQSPRLASLLGNRYYDVYYEIMRK